MDANASECDCDANFILRLYEIEAIKFGSFKLKTGLISPIYIDLRVIVSYPDVLRTVGDKLWALALRNNVACNSICGVPYTALPIAAVISINYNVPMVIKRKEQKTHGTGKMIEGAFSINDKCLIIEDVIVSGASIIETVEVLNSNGLKVSQAVVLVDREQGGQSILKRHSIEALCVTNISRVLDVLLEAGKITQTGFDEIRQFIKNNQVDDVDRPAPSHRSILTYEQRSDELTNPVAKRLFRVMADKKTNLAVAADVATSSTLLQLANDVGPHICILKIHVDIISDFCAETVSQLRDIALLHNFLLFEDRKFCDIGNTVSLQYHGGIHRISDWADIISVHTISGAGILAGLRKNGSVDRACVLVAEMSSEHNLISPKYTNDSIKMALDFKDFVIGIVCQSGLAQGSNLIRFTPGIDMSTTNGDGLGQKFNTPEFAVTQLFSDVIIVGSAIIDSKNAADVANSYKMAGYDAYCKILVDN